MKKSPIFLALLVCLLVSCETTRYVPAPVTAEMAKTSKGRRVDLVMLGDGRRLFVHRCIECHTLPAVWHYSADDWPELVDNMSARASLKPAERDAIVAYILAIRAQL